MDYLGGKIANNVYRQTHFLSFFKSLFFFFFLPHGLQNLSSLTKV